MRTLLAAALLGLVVTVGAQDQMHRRLVEVKEKPRLRGSKILAQLLDAPFSQ